MQFDADPARAGKGEVAGHPLQRVAVDVIRELDRVGVPLVPGVAPDDAEEVGMGAARRRQRGRIARLGAVHYGWRQQQQRQQAADDGGTGTVATHL